MGYSDVEVHTGYLVVQIICAPIALTIFALHAVLFWGEPACLRVRARCCSRVPKPVSSGLLHSLLRSVGLFNSAVFCIYWVWLQPMRCHATHGFAAIGRPRLPFSCHALWPGQLREYHQPARDLLHGKA